jgi:hypothetical protein
MLIPQIPGSAVEVAENAIQINPLLPQEAPQEFLTIQ